jgi:hypothetical protein
VEKIFIEEMIFWQKKHCLSEAARLANNDNEFNDQVYNEIESFENEQKVELSDENLFNLSSSNPNAKTEDKNSPSLISSPSPLYSSSAYLPSLSLSSSSISILSPPLFDEPSFTYRNFSASNSAFVPSVIRSLFSILSQLPSVIVMNRHLFTSSKNRKAVCKDIDLDSFFFFFHNIFNSINIYNDICFSMCSK